MPYTEPTTRATGDLITAALWNADLVENIKDLNRRATTTQGVITTDESTTATSFADLATIGPSVTVTVGSDGRLLVAVFAWTRNSAAGSQTFMSVALSGATTSAGADVRSALAAHPTANLTTSMTWFGVYTGIPAGSVTVTAKYRGSTGTSNFSNRRVIAIPF